MHRHLKLPIRNMDFRCLIKHLELYTIIFFNFKVDLDIGGTMNSYSTYNVELNEASNPFSKECPASNMFQEKTVKVDYAAERDAAYNSRNLRVYSRKFRVYS